MKIPRPLAIALWPLSRVYGWCVSVRKWLYAHGWLRTKRLQAAVISVGNLTTGGTGKTPMVLWLAERFLAEGKRVAILSRGYRGSAGISDEIEVLKRRLSDRVKFGVGAERYASGRAIESQQVIDVFLLDDGFQHLQLARDLDIVMLDGSRKLKTEWLLPAGSLREPLTACRRADILIVSRKFERPPIEARDADKFCIFYAQTRLLGFRRLGAAGEPVYLSEIGTEPLSAFCGIGNPAAFFADLKRWHVPIVRTNAFADHHKYSQRDVAHLQSEAERSGVTGLVTTEKDAANLPASGFRMPVWVAVIDFVFSAESELLAAIDRLLQARRGAAA
jgi:tetraacyldisaccharide 4'-kinase